VEFQDADNVLDGEGDELIGMEPYDAFDSPHKK